MKYIILFLFVKIFASNVAIMTSSYLDSFEVRNAFKIYLEDILKDREVSTNIDIFEAAELPEMIKKFNNHQLDMLDLNLFDYIENFNKIKNVDFIVGITKGKKRAFYIVGYLDSKNILLPKRFKKWSFIISNYYLRKKKLNIKDYQVNYIMSYKEILLNIFFSKELGMVPKEVFDFMKELNPQISKIPILYEINLPIVEKVTLVSKYSNKKLKEVYINAIENYKKDKKILKALELFRYDRMFIYPKSDIIILKNFLKEYKDGL